MYQDLKFLKTHKFAFTLAEVLITLGIIGIVAAMTLPALIQNHQKKVTIEQLKKTYSVISQAVNSSVAENGSTEYWDYSLSAKDFFEKYLSKYLKKTKEAPLTTIKNKITYKYLNGEPDRGGLNNVNSYGVKLSDGTLVYIDGWTDSKTRNVIIDLNGYTKPNQTGKDVFWFIIFPKIGFLPSEPDAQVNVPNDFRACNKQHTGYYCSAKIMYDGWEIKDDYPW